MMLIALGVTVVSVGVIAVVFLLVALHRADAEIDRAFPPKKDRR